jgi:DNA polymerase-3 subunit alpha
METIPSYIERKHNPKLVHYLDPRMKEYLEFSNGVLVYQDDVLLTAIKLGGYSWLEADALRKAMGKKIPKVMQAEKEKLLKGFMAYGKLSKDLSEKLWELIEPFAAYGFNKAHAASYGKVAYQTAYMKANYPVEYLAALLTADSGDTDQISIYVAEAKRMGVSVLPPDVNESGTDFTVVAHGKEGSSPHGSIRFGLSSIKNFGDGISEAIIAERMARGPFKTLSDFLSRVGSKNLNRKSLESLIKCGALDSLGERGTLLTHVEDLLAFHREATASAPQDSLFGALAAPSDITLTDGTPSSLLDKLAWEKELLGIYVSGHPLDAYTDITKKAALNLKQIKEEKQQGRLVILPVLVTVVRSILTKGGEKMAFVTVEDKSDSIEAVVFPTLLKTHSAALVSGACFLAKAKVSIRNSEVTLAIEELKLL